MNRHRILLAMLVFLFLGCLGLGLVQVLSKGDFPEAERQAPEILEAAACNAAAQPCVVTRSDVEVTLELGPGIRPLAAFPVLVEVTGMSLQRVDVRFDMQDMSMGINRFQLQSAGSGRWRGESMLPVCWTGRRDWDATVELRGASRDLDVVFRFVTD